jgi:hypothetical protein
MVWHGGKFVVFDKCKQHTKKWSIGQWPKKFFFLDRNRVVGSH